MGGESDLPEAVAKRQYFLLGVKEMAQLYKANNEMDKLKKLYEQIQGDGEAVESFMDGTIAAGTPPSSEPDG